MLGAAAIAVYGTYSLVSALQKPDEAASNQAAAGSLVIAPPAAFVNTTLQARLAGKRGASADPGACRWFVDDVEIEGVSTSSLEPGHFKKGDRVRVEGTGEGATLASEPVVIANTPPRITMASAELKSDGGGEIVVRISSVDADNDPINYTYEWFKNGSPVLGETGASIDVSKFQKGDNVHAEVSASDGEASSAPRKSDSIKLGTNAPKITSTPPQALEADRRFVYQVKVAPGSGSVKYELVESPDGMSIDNGGRIEWTVPAHDDPDATREHRAVVRVTDSTGGWSTQEFRITTSIQAGLNE
jgi:hypothetical protein